MQPSILPAIHSTNPPIHGPPIHVCPRVWTCTFRTLHIPLKGERSSPPANGIFNYLRHRTEVTSGVFSASGKRVSVKENSCTPARLEECKNKKNLKKIVCFYNGFVWRSLGEAMGSWEAEDFFSKSCNPESNAIKSAMTTE